MPIVLSSTDVVSQVASKLLDAFAGKITTVYKDTPLQGMIKPCFFIQQLNTIHTSELKCRGERTYFLDVRAHPLDDEYEKFTWCNSVGHDLFEVLETIVVDGQQVKAHSMKFEIQENVLHFFVEYSFKVRKLEKPQIKMKTLDTNQILSQYGKGGN